MSRSPRPTVDPLFIAFQDTLTGRYSLDREIGRGGMGIVYLAREVGLDRPVAIKLLPPERARDATLRDRFLREARLAAKLSHPNIIPIHAVEAVGEFVFYVMSFIDGVTLADRVRQRGPLPASEGIRLLRDAAIALGCAHAQGLVHRDVKPDNILIESATGRAFVADFGIAALAEDPSTGITGTPEFMSPEQALGKDLDPRSDIYSLGVTAYYAFSGRLPFEGKTPTEIVAKHVATPAPPIGSVGVNVPRRVAALIDRCLAKDPERRPPSAESVATTLSSALEQRREIPAALRAFVKRHGRFDGMASAFYPLLALGAGVAAAESIGSNVGLVTFLGAMAAGPIIGAIAAARKLVETGFTPKDLEPAFKAELEIGREERAMERPTERQLRAQETHRKLTIVLGAAGSLSCAVGVSFRLGFIPRFFVSGVLTPLLTVLVFAGAAALPVGLLYYLSLQRRRDVDTEFWQRVWTGRAGEIAFKIARRLTSRHEITASMTHRPTELSLGLAVDSLYESLPRATRNDIGDVPAAARALEQDAQRLRALLEEMNAGLALIGDSESSHEYVEARADRDRVQAKMTDVVSALETIRLNLLRLHAGSQTAESFTTHLGLAADITAEVERLLDAQNEIDRSLRIFPREIEPTPV